MKRKRNIVNKTTKKYKCRFRECKDFTDKINEIFCIEHRKYVTNIQNSDEIFYSTQHTLEIPYDICVYILIMNIPHLNIIRQNIPKENSKTTYGMNNIDAMMMLAQELTLLSDFEMRDIHIYMSRISLISNKIKDLFEKYISPLYSKIFVLDCDNIKIPTRNSLYEEGNNDIREHIILLTKNNPSGQFLWNDMNLEIMKYYTMKRKIMQLQSEVRKAKSESQKKKNEIYLNLIQKTKKISS